MMSFRLKLQLAEALGPDNRWFCSQCYGREISDQETLLEYFIRQGGAESFALRYSEAMGSENRWYCSQHHQRNIDDLQTLWNYYMKHGGGEAITPRRCELSTSY